MTTPHIDTWLGLLDAACAQGSSTCLDIIIDQSGGDEPWLSSVLSVEPPLPWYSLFTGMPEEAAEELAPLLVRVDLAQPLQRHWLAGLMHELDGCSQLLALASMWPFQALAEYLDRCLEASNGGCPGLLRYYDPRLFPLLFSHVLEPGQQQALLRPVLFWSWLDRDGAPQRLLGAADTPDSLETFKPFDLSDSQLETLGCASDATLALENLRTALPAEWSAERRFQACYAAMLDATEAGVLVDTEREAFTLDRVRKA
ncbi:DUF4123 domain-containing protein [Pseudomonas gingeri]|uniref:DUF4123 domain-containing protein n=1 Tax=Pseudomonas gingeri TaxID=117681 RepID=UPI0015A38D23|nr:DUF4123 domain-containing protein [Pseudomonas gingeri]NWA05004.1 DUF4123 domain-containing protein [Pseudomonas gingeri]NWA17172.1 DUF4123 domain-containing protein [Pseudomonas gingeri]NWA59097.1 DUF4123 domain-containing protein [Pseudomonas gingeri]NWA99646.1 DUF4123 domain-containing protein [Pseudomonas gingeri]NWB06154.1 DUF4123 domain-containing protein [Pseudomonas gingeri]